MDLKDYIQSRADENLSNAGGDCEVSSQRNGTGEAVFKADINTG